MKITYLSKEDRNEFEKIYKECFKNDDGGFSDFFFSDLFDSGEHFVLKEDDRIVSIASCFPHSFYLNGKRIKVSMITNVATIPGLRNKGYMKALLNEIIDQKNHQELVTLIQAYHPEIYKSFGFEIMYHRHRYHFNRNDFKMVDVNGVTSDIKCEDLEIMYQRFTKHFNGYYLRDLKYYQTYLKQLKAMDYHIRAIYDGDIIRGYFTFHLNKNEIVIDECIYVDTKTLMMMISYCLHIKENVTVCVSEFERLDRLFDTYKDTDDYTLVKINDYQLFNKLYDVECKDVKEAFFISGKPLFMREDY